MKKEVMDILQNELVFDRLSGSAGNITAVSMGDKHYFREKGKTECPKTKRQQTHHQVTARGVAAWQNLATDKQEQWNRLVGQVKPHSWPFNDDSRLSGYLQLASIGREGIPEPDCSLVGVPQLSLKLTGISESDSSTLNIECRATPAIPDSFCIIARIKVHAYGCDCNPGYKLSRRGGDVEISNNISEQSVRKLKMNLRNAGNIGSESSAADNAFMYSVIESCKLNDINPGKYISYLLGKLKTAREGEDLTGLLPCYCGL